MELSFPEILLILAIALIVLGPHEMIKTSRTLGQWMGKVKTQLNNYKVLLNEELLQEERKKAEELLSKKIDIVDEKKTDKEDG